MKDLEKLVQPIDGYVKILLKNVDVDPDNVSRADRLKAAMKYHNQGDSFSAMEIMVGRRVDSSENAARMYAQLLIVNKMTNGNPESFYEGFAHIYYPKEE